VLGVEDRVGAGVALVEDRLHRRQDLLRDSAPVELLVGERLGVELHQRLHATNLVGDVLQVHLLIAEVLEPLGFEERLREPDHGLLPVALDQLQELRLVLVDRSQGLLGQVAADPVAVVAVADVGAQQVRQLRQVRRLRDHLAREPVGQQHLHGHWTPAERIAGRIGRAGPHHASDQVPLIRADQCGSTTGPRRRSASPT
jgi:hypothetical protein